MQKNIYVFLSRSEIKIYNSNYLTINLPREDTRLTTLLEYKRDIKIVLINPDTTWLTKFFPDRWYILDKLKFSSTYDYYKCTQVSFNWYNNLRKLEDHEVYFFRKNHYFQTDVINKKLLPAKSKLSTADKIF